MIKYLERIHHLKQWNDRKVSMSLLKFCKTATNQPPSFQKIYGYAWPIKQNERGVIIILILIIK